MKQLKLVKKRMKIGKKPLKNMQVLFSTSVLIEQIML